MLPCPEAAQAAAPMAGSLRVLAVLSVLMGFASISTDLYLPALPAMAAALGTGAGTMELTISST
jgi:DHA1 family bicyclomycin/chloramphenicol resistance-like MFS transporter